MNGFNPVPKPSFNKKPKAKNTLRRQKGRAIPTRGERGKIDKKNARKMYEVFGEYCQGCYTSGNELEIHHIVFKSQGGRKVWRNLAPLCRDCHGACHGKYRDAAHKKAAEGLQASLIRKRKEKYGDYFYCDVWDLYTMNLVTDTTEKEYLRFVELEEIKCQANKR